MITYQRRVIIVMMFIITPVFLSNFATNTIFGQDESETTYTWSIRSLLVFLTTSGQSHGGTG
jgi:hypothetical protein